MHTHWDYLPTWLCRISLISSRICFSLSFFQLFSLQPMTEFLFKTDAYTLTLLSWFLLGLILRPNWNQGPRELPYYRMKNEAVCEITYCIKNGSNPCFLITCDKSLGWYEKLLRFSFIFSSVSLFSGFFSIVIDCTKLW